MPARRGRSPGSPACARHLQAPSQGRDRPDDCGDVRCALLPPCTVRSTTLRYLAACHGVSNCSDGCSPSSHPRRLASRPSCLRFGAAGPATHQHPVRPAFRRASVGPARQDHPSCPRPGWSEPVLMVCAMAAAVWTSTTCSTNMAVVSDGAWRRAPYRMRCRCRGRPQPASTFCPVVHPSLGIGVDTSGTYRQ